MRDNRRDACDYESDRGSGEPSRCKSSDRRPPATLTAGGGRHRIAPNLHSICLDRSRNVLHPLCTEVLEAQAEFVENLVAHRLADTDAARIGERLQPRGDVDTVAEDVSAVDDDVADVDTDAKVDAPVVGRPG